MTGIQFVTDEKGRKTGVLIDLKKHGANRVGKYSLDIKASAQKEFDALDSALFARLYIG